MSLPSVPERERGAALLAVLLLVAITGALAAAAMEKMRLSRALAANVLAVEHARAWSGGMTELALLTIDDMVTRSPGRTTNAGGWNGAVRRVRLPDGTGFIEGSVRDGGNCFNVNSLVNGDPATGLSQRRSGIEQFYSLMTVLDVPQSEARRIAEAAADWTDSDTMGNSQGAEDVVYASGERPMRTGNTLFADVSELRPLAGMTAETYARLHPWLCALPTTDLSPLNVNMLTPEQAPLLAMLAPDQLGIEGARRAILARPAAGWTSTLDFWRAGKLGEMDVPLDVRLQPQVRSRWFVVKLRTRILELDYEEAVLVDARIQPARVVSRWSGDSISW